MQEEIVTNPRILKAKPYSHYKMHPYVYMSKWDCKGKMTFMDCMECHIVASIKCILTFNLVWAELDLKSNTKQPY